jgi:N-acetylmuramoyl-L-alanine amidase
MKIAIDIGHNCPPKDTGAVGFGKECAMNKAVGEALIALLIKAGVDVIDCRPRAGAETVRMSLWKRTNAANLANADFYVSIHHNAGGGHGSEIFAISDDGRSAAGKVLQQLVNLGWRNRGVKYKVFPVLLDTIMAAILIEVCFVDSKSDVELWNQLGANRVAQAIFDGLREALKF